MMNMIIDVKRFLVYVEAIAAEEPSYRIGGYGSDGTCDCIGLIIGAIRRAGGSWAGLHGSNYAARNEVVDLEQIHSSGDLRAGEVVFKAHPPGEEGYDAETINGRYASSPDKNDYYHVGVVVSVNPLRIRHMTTPKPKTDTSLGKWRYHGWLKKVSEDDGGSQMQENVIIRGGNESATINLRAGPSTDHRIIHDIMQGRAAVLLEVVNDKWCKIRVDGKTGYVQQVFVRRPETVSTQPTNGTIQVPADKLEQIYDMIGDWLGRRG